MQLTDGIGLLAGACTTLSFIPQALMVWRNGHAQGVSLGMYVIFVTGVALWLGYGWLIQAWPVVIANAITLLLAGYILSVKLRRG
jgi:MtN3 and saliva related transmembrane protein